MARLAQQPPQYADDGPDACWPWQGLRNVYGYGIIGSGATIQMAHRVVYELLVGPIPDGLDLDHLCRVRHCVNPAHLEPVTRTENIRRGQGASVRNSRVTHCPRGHEYTPENTRVQERRPGRMVRYCRQCAREKAREYAHRLRETRRLHGDFELDGGPR